MIKSDEIGKVPRSSGQRAIQHRKDELTRLIRHNEEVIEEINDELSLIPLSCTRVREILRVRLQQLKQNVTLFEEKRARLP